MGHAELAGIEREGRIRRAAVGDEADMAPGGWIFIRPASDHDVIDEIEKAHAVPAADSHARIARNGGEAISERRAACGGFLDGRAEDNSGARTSSGGGLQGRFKSIIGYGKDGAVNNLG